MNSAVTALVARCLLDPGYVDRLAAAERTESAALSHGEQVCGVAGELDVGRVRLFGGFISKVQHNDVWSQFPVTCSLLRLCGAELEVFADYRARHLELIRRGKPTPALKTVALLDFLEERIRGSAGINCPGLLDVLTHERLQWEVAQSLEQHCPSGTTPAPGPIRTDGLDGRVVLARDILRVAALAHDPVQIASCLHDGGHQLCELEPKATCFCYSGRSSTETVSVVEVDTFTAAVLASVDGVRSVSHVLDEAQILLPEAPRTVVGRVLEGAVDRGLVQLVDAPHRE